MIRRLLSSVMVGLALLGSAPASASPQIAVDVGGGRVDTVLGDTVTLPVTISNNGDGATGDLVAHLLVIDPASEVSADAEDWTDQLTRPLQSLTGGGSVTLDWEVTPISTGTFHLLVAVAPLDGTSAPPALSPTMIFTVSSPTTPLENTVIPVAVVVPLVIGALALVSRRRERRRVESLLPSPS